MPASTKQPVEHSLTRNSDSPATPAADLHETCRTAGGGRHPTGGKCNDYAYLRPMTAPRIHRITSARSSPACHDGFAPPRGFEPSDRSSLRSSRPDSSRWPSDRSSLRSSRPDSQRRPAPASSPLHHCIYRRALGAIRPALRPLPWASYALYAFVAAALTNSVFNLSIVSSRRSHISEK